jgi:hypothetical protein
MAAEVADLVIKVHREGVTEATAELKGLGHEAGDSGDQAFTASVSWDALQKVIGAAGEAAARSAIDYLTQGRAMNYASDQADQLSRSMAKNALLRGAGVGGGPPGTGVATDIGSAFRFASNAAQGLLTVITLISPTVNLIIAAVIGLLSPLVAATAAAVGLGAAIGAVGIGMVAVSLKWRSLLSTTTDGVDHVRGAVLAVEAELFKASQGAIAAFGGVGGGANPFDTFAKVTITAIKLVEPYINQVADWIGNFVHGLTQVPGHISPIVQWFKTWIDEWKVLGQVVNDGIKSGGGFIAFLQKYEAPAKAFVEGIARVINALAKGMQMGLGLNMPQLTEFINNLFEAIAKLVPGWLRFSNALTQVGLNVTRLLNTMAPIVSQMFTVGAAILQHLVAPLVDGLLKALDAVMKVPFLRWIVELGGGVAVAAFGISKLTFGLLTTAQVLRGKAIVAMAGFIAETIKLRGAGTWVEVLATQFPRLTGFIQKAWTAAQGLGTQLSGGKLQGTSAGILGVSAAAAVLVGTTIVLDQAFQAYNDTQQRVSAEMANIIQLMGQGSISIEQATTQMTALQVASIGTQSTLSKLGYGLTHLKETGAGVIGMVTSGIPYIGQWTSQWAGNMAVADKVAATNQAMTDSFTEQSKNLVGVIHDTGSLTAAQVDYLTTMKNSAQGLGAYNDFLAQTKQMYDTHVISLGEYTTVLTQLGITWTQTGEQGNLALLKLQGASNSIAQGLNDLTKATAGSTKGWESFATATGQSATALKQDALAAINDVQGGILGTGQKITEFLKTQSDAIDTWKTNLADSVNFVNQAWGTLAQDAQLTNDKIISTLDKAVQQTKQLAKDMKATAQRGLSKEALTQIFTLPGDQQAALFSQLSQMSRKQIQHVNADVKKGGDLAAGYADTAAGAIDLTMQKVATALELLVSNQLGIPFRQLAGRVDRLVGDVNTKTGKLKDRHIKIDFQTQAAVKAGAQAVGSAKSVAAQFLPSQAALHQAGQQAGQAAMTGVSTGIQAGTAQVQTQAQNAGNQGVKALQQSTSPGKMQKVGADAVKGVANGIVSTTPSLVAGMVQAGTNMAAGLRIGLLQGLAETKTAAVAAALDIANAVKDATKQHSPSQLFYDIGKNMGDGLRLGFGDSMDGMTRDVRTRQKKLQSGWGYSGGRRRQRIEGRLDFDWKRGVANLAGAEAWSQRNAV